VIDIDDGFGRWIDVEEEVTASSMVVFAMTRPETAVVPVSFAAVQKIHHQQSTTSNAKSLNPTSIFYVH
jgi:hypothetical protein